MKILFIKPYSHAPYQIIDMPVGILYLSAYLKQQMGDRVQIGFIDLRVEKQRKQALIDMLTTFKPDLVGISLLSFEQFHLPLYLDIVRTHAPLARIILGGPLVTTSYRDVLRQFDVDGAVVGEGETVLAEIVNALMGGETIHDIGGVAYKENGRIVCNPQPPYIEDLDSLPFPDYDLIDMKRYWGWHYQMNVLLAEKRFAPVLSSRGCPFHCIYCHTIFGKKLRQRGPDHFVAELRLLHDKYGIREFHIIDDIFNCDRARMHAILELIISSGMRIRLAFPNGLRGDLLTREDILLLKKAGAYMLTFALETGSERMQAKIHKHLNIEKVMRNIEFASCIGLMTKGFFMMGFPGETVEELNKTVDLAVRSDLDLAYFFDVVPFPGTPLFELASRLHPELARRGSDYFYSSEHSFYQDATHYNLRKLKRIAHTRFYSAPRVLRQFIKAPRKFYFLIIYIKAVIEMLTILHRKYKGIPV